MPTITQNHTTVNYSAQNGAKRYIVWHDTGVKGQTAAGNANYFKSVDRQASAHYFVDKTSIYEVVAPNLVAWHCGDGNGAYGITNANSIGIELCPEADGSIHAQTLANALLLGKKLMSDYGISYDNNVRHYDASRKNCPQYLNTDGRWTKWYAFKAQLNTPTVAAPVAPPAPTVTFSGQAHIQNKGWVEMANNVLGTVGESLRLEAFSLVVKNKGVVQPIDGVIHVQDIGDVGYQSGTNLFGTVGQEKRLEAVKINVGNGVQYRAHIESLGWSVWVRSGEWVGTTGKSLRIEALEFRVA